MPTKTPAELWVEALRSGEFQQTTTRLSDGKSYCCLGVACELYERHIGGLTIVPNTVDGTSYDGETGTLPDDVVQWLGLNDCEGLHYDDEGLQKTLHELNDGGKDFDYLADLIESRPSGLFE